MLINRQVRLQGCCTEYSLAKVFREDRLVLSFQIITEGEYFGKSLQWWFGGIEVRKKGIRAGSTRRATLGPFIWPILILDDTT